MAATTTPAALAWRALACWCLLCGWSAALCAEPPNLKEAEQLYLRGRYAEAAALLEPAAEGDIAAAVGLARCRLAVGKRDEAEEMLKSAAQRDKKAALPRAEWAVLAWESGEYERAGKLAAEALALDADSLPARWVQAELLKYSGKLAEAERAYEWFVDFHNRAPRIERTDNLRYIGLAAAELARWTRSQNGFRNLVGDFYPAALRREPNYWPAHLAAARLFAEKYNEPAALAEIAAGLTINPNSAELHAARAELALHNFDLATAKTSLARALEINPQLLVACQLQADLLLADVRPSEAIEALRPALRLNPRSEATLGRLAAAYAAVDGMPAGEPAPRMQELLEKAGSHNPHSGELYLALAESCDRMRRFPLAARYYREAQRVMPQLIGVRGQLGMTLMRLGEEATAAQLLEEAFTIDPFNVRVKNTLEVLDLLQTYAILETEHFVLKFDRGQDELLARYAARYLEQEIFPQLVKEFGYEPPGKTLIEIFSRARNTSGHGWFSARMVGLPFIGTVGACAGKMIALASPDEMPKKYNWAHVLRHEYVHVINLQQTDFHVPHWLTEGLAVFSEKLPRPATWSNLLARRAAEEDLFDLDSITLGFIRPQSGDDWTLAYCQAELYVEFVRQEYGDDAPGRMLAAYGEQRSTPQVLEKCFDVAQADFEAAYRQYVKKIIAQEASGASTSGLSLAELQRAAEKDPTSAAAAAELARAYWLRNSKPEARRWALAAQKLEPQQPVAAYVLARLELSIGDTESASKLLADALDENDLDQTSEEALALLAGLKLQAGDLAAAERLHLLGHKHFPRSERWPKGLARIYLQTSAAEKLRPVLVRLAELDADSVPIRQKLAQLAIDAQEFSTATRWATAALHLDVQDATTHALLAAAAAGEQHHAVAAEEYETAIRLDGTNAAWRFAHVQTLVKLGQTAAARAALVELRELDANYPGLNELQKSIAP